MLKSFGNPESDILTVAVNKEGTVAYSAGVQPTLLTFERITGAGDQVTWVRSHVKTHHTHDIRAITTTDNAVISGGVDCHLVVNSIKTKQCRKIPAIPQVSSCGLRYRKRSLMS